VSHGWTIEVEVNLRPTVSRPVCLRAGNPEVYLGHPIPGGYKCGDLALQIGGVTDETVKYGREFCGTSAQEWLLWQGPETILQ
jgi:hypothetical protein